MASDQKAGAPLSLDMAEAIRMQTAANKLQLEHEQKMAEIQKEAHARHMEWLAAEKRTQTSAPSVGRAEKVTVAWNSTSPPQQ